MSFYWLAVGVAGVALVVLGVLGRWAFALFRRFRVLAVAYRRHLSAESALLRHRRGDLVAELARRRGRTAPTRPRTMR